MTENRIKYVGAPLSTNPIHYYSIRSSEERGWELLWLACGSFGCRHVVLTCYFRNKKPCPCCLFTAIRSRKKSSIFSNRNRLVNRWHSIARIVYRERFEWDSESIRLTSSKSRPYRANRRRSTTRSTSLTTAIKHSRSTLVREPRTFVRTSPIVSKSNQPKASAFSSRYQTKVRNYTHFYHTLGGVWVCSYQRTGKRFLF